MATEFQFSEVTGAREAAELVRDVEVEMYGFWHPKKSRLIAIRARLSSKFDDYLKQNIGSAKYKFQLFGQKCRVNLKRMTVDLDAKGDSEALIALSLVPLREMGDKTNRVSGILKRGSILPADTGDQRLLTEHFVIDAGSFIIAVHSNSVETSEKFFMKTSGIDMSGEMDISFGDGTTSKADWVQFKALTKSHTCSVDFKVVREYPSRLFKATDLKLRESISHSKMSDLLSTGDETKAELTPLEPVVPQHIDSKLTLEMPAPVSEKVSPLLPYPVEQIQSWPPVRSDAIKGKVVCIHHRLESAYLVEETEFDMRAYKLYFDRTELIYRQKDRSGHRLAKDDTVVFEDFECKEDRIIVGKAYVIPAIEKLSDPVSIEKVNQYSPPDMEISEVEKEAEEMGLPKEYWKNLLNENQQIEMLLKHTQSTCGSWFREVYVIPAIDQQFILEEIRRILEELLNDFNYIEKIMKYLQ